MTRYIDADALEKAINEWMPKNQEELMASSIPPIENLAVSILMTIEEQPTIDAEPVRHGKWITEECLPGVAVCSICGHEIRGIGCQYTNYCDECGARMDEE